MLVYQTFKLSYVRLRRRQERWHRETVNRIEKYSNIVQESSFCWILRPRIFLLMPLLRRLPQCSSFRLRFTHFKNISLQITNTSIETVQDKFSAICFWRPSIHDQMRMRVADC